MVRKKNFKGSGYSVIEDLTKINYDLLRNAFKDQRCKNSWSFDGKVFIEDKDGKVKKINSMEDL